VGKAVLDSGVGSGAGNFPGTIADATGAGAGVVGDGSGGFGVASTVGETPNTFSATRANKLGLGVGVGVGAATIVVSRFDSVEESPPGLDSDVADETSGELVLDSTVETETISVSEISSGLDSDVADETSGELVSDSTVETETISVSEISSASEELHPTSNINNKLAVKIILIIFKSQPESRNINSSYSVGSSQNEV
jgi:hypothetical protein